MTVILRGLRLYTKCSPFRRGRGAFIRPIEALKRGGWPSPLVTADCGVKMEFEPSLLGWTVFERGAWEPEQSALVLGFLHSGGVVVNVGANTGYYALLAAAAVGPTGQVHAFEIQPEVLKILTRNVAHNHFEATVCVVAAGCWSSVREVTIEPHGDPGSARIGFAVDGIRVPLTTIDSYVAARGIERVDLILIDTEGADFEVLKGAADVLKRFRPIVMAEAHHLRAFGSSEDEMRAYMAEYGYSSRTVDSEFSRDVLFLPQMEPTALATG